MNIVGFPKMFSGNSTNVLTADSNSREASLESLTLLLNTECGELFGDPDYGIKLKYYYFNQNNVILKDILIDEIYTKITMFCPQLIVSRNDITITQENNNALIQIVAKNKLDYQTNTYNLQLKVEDEQ